VTDWTLALELDGERSISGGSRSALSDAIRRAADLRIYTEFRHNEHIDVTSDSTEVVREVAEFGETYLLQDSWAAGIMTLRQPVDLPRGFGPRPSMSFFLYNQDGQQAIARPHLDGPASSGTPGPSPLTGDLSMPKLHQQDSWDASTNAPSHNFIYDFDVFRFWVRDNWNEVLAHDDDGAVRSGSVEALADAFSNGSEVKVGISGLCADLADGPADSIEHEVFIQVGSCYYYTEARLFIGATHPFVRVRPAVPLAYGSRAWDFGWAMAKTDGRAELLLADPYSLKFRRLQERYPIRWFVR
jgi:hypothetical protein